MPTMFMFNFRNEFYHFRIKHPYSLLSRTFFLGLLFQILLVMILPLTGIFSPGNGYRITLADGKLIGHAYIFFPATSVNVGYRQIIEGSVAGSIQLPPYIFFPDTSVKRGVVRSMQIPRWAADQPKSGFTAVITEGIGWPFRLLVVESQIDHNNLVHREMLWHIAPLGLLNLFLFWLIVLLSAVAGGFLIQKYRLKKGRCPMCAYITTGLDYCPECGWNT